jgi:glycine betaine/proline transport system permease protein
VVICAILRRLLILVFAASRAPTVRGIENFFDPLLQFMIWFERLLINSPWPIILLVIAGTGLAWLTKLEARCWFGRLFYRYRFFWHVGKHYGYIGYHFGGDLWFVLALGIPLGIWMAKSNRVQSIITPVLDVMQTIPSFVYLIPVVMLLGIGKVPGLIAVCIYAAPPIVRLTNLGIRLVDEEVLEAADAFGANYKQRLWGVQIPLALPNIFAGVNQTIMMALAMVVIASMIGVRGLGVPVLQAVSNQYLALGLMNGLAIVAIAIIFDRVSQKYGQRLQAYRKGNGNG